MFKSFMNKRMARRKEGDYHLKYTFVEGNSVEFNVLAKDVSGKGFSVESKEQIELGTSIKGEVVFSFLSTPVKFLGKVVRVQKLANNRYLYGVSFDQLDQSNQDLIGKYVEKMDFNTLLNSALKEKADSLHLIVGCVPTCRIDRQISHLDVVPLTAEDVKGMVFSILNEKQKADLYKNCELDLAYTLPPENCRFRVNIFFDKGNLGIAVKIVNREVKTFEELCLPNIIQSIVSKKHGLILVTGPVDSGKSTTLASLIESMNLKRESVIVCIEDPIEYIYTSKNSLICQRDVGLDTLSFSNALKSALRQNADVVLVGEMRDLDSVSQAISAAEEGYLVLSTMHTTSTVDCINRLIDIFPAEQQAQIRVQLFTCLEYIIGQYLLPRADGKGRIVATEVLVATPAIKNLIRSARTEQIFSYLESGTEFGMHSMDSSIMELLGRGLITKEVAYAFASDKKRFEYL